jgi:SEC-C motif-containing protein
MNNCPCDSGLTFNKCCEPFHKGKQQPVRAEQLMRARYSAYVVVDTDFIFNTTHPDHRKGYDHEGTREWAEKAEWEGLEIVACREGGPEDDKGEVEFIARYREKSLEKVHHELAQFEKSDGSWYFTDGKLVTNKPIVRSGPKVGRNDPCSCGSGQKYKKCCGK